MIYKLKAFPNCIVLLSSLLILFSGTQLLGQSRMKEGFIVTNQNDTIEGQVASRSNAKNYKSCLFQNEDRSDEYTSSQIKGFGYLNDKFFISNVVNSHFVEALVIGEISLYKFEESFYLEKSQSLYKLDSKDLLIEVDGRLTTQKDNKWKEPIYSSIVDCLSEAEDLASKLSFSEKALTKLVAKYNHCKSDNSVILKESKSWTEVEIGASIGLLRSNVSITNDQVGSPVFLADSYKATGPVFGLLMIMSFPRIYQGVALQSELQYIKSYYSELVSIKFLTEYHDTSIELSTLSVPLAFRYSFPERDNGLSLSLQGGLNYDYHLKAKTERLSERISGNVVSTFPKAPAFEVNKSQLGFLAGLDILKSFDKFRGGISLRYVRTPDLSKSAGFRANIHRLMLNLIVLKK